MSHDPPTKHPREQARKSRTVAPSASGGCYAQTSPMEPSNRICPKKRKIPHDRSEPDEEEIEKFFGLIRTVREARDRLSTYPGTTEGGSAVKKRSQLEEPTKPASPWKPTFKLEDFMHNTRRADVDIHGDRTYDSNSRGKLGRGKDHRDMEVSLDLTLSL